MGANKKPTAPTAPTAETYCVFARIARFKYLVGAVGFFSLTYSIAVKYF